MRSSNCYRKKIYIKPCLGTLRVRLIEYCWAILRRCQQQKRKVKCPICSSDYNNISILSADWHECPCTKIHANSSSWSRVNAWGSSDRRMDERVNMHEEVNSRFSRLTRKRLEMVHTFWTHWTFKKKKTLWGLETSQTTNPPSGRHIA
jgi:hypothetical protein